jgi:hypothetical protein
MRAAALQILKTHKTIEATGQSLVQTRLQIPYGESIMV